MPELPEVETICRGINPFLLHKKVTDIIIRYPKLRWPIPKEIQEIKGQIIQSIVRRGKYILLQTQSGTALIHLGMSGRLHIVPKDTFVKKHDHVDVIFENTLCLRFNDARRFGALLWTSEKIEQHPLLSKLGLEPLSAKFDGEYLLQHSKNISKAVKLYIMDSHIVVGVGNIYANESLFAAGIDPRTPTNKISKTRFIKLANAIKTILQEAINVGGTTLKDFQHADGKPGYFQQVLKVYGRYDQPCIRCQKPLKKICLGQRTTVYCEKCQQ